MPHPEPDADFRARLLRVVPATDLSVAMVAAGDKLDALGRKYDRFRTGVPLKASAAPQSDEQQSALGRIEAAPAHRRTFNGAGG